MLTMGLIQQYLSTLFFFCFVKLFLRKIYVRFMTDDVKKMSQDLRSEENNNNNFFSGGQTCPEFSESESAARFMVMSYE